ncbi:MAG TPA: DEAD/DEAH box helicase [Kofleriaceae bacterium]|nr:DEAD/DEAH box helicase [Kofleriaceae bacterium]
MSVAADVLDAFHPLIGGWFRDRFGAPTAPQREGWPRIAAGEDVLIAAPTGSGKTLAAFLACLDALVRRGLTGPLPDHTSILYISPLKALSNDVHRNLEAPLAELAARAALRGEAFPEIRVGVRTGDTPVGERAKMAKKPPHILVTTPESLFILLTTQSGRAALGQLDTVILDEIHAVAGDKRGAHLALSLERLDRLVTQTVGRTPVRVGLSATQRPIERIARLLVGTKRELPHIVDGGHRREIDLAIEITDDELGAVASNEQFGRVYDRIAELVTQHRSTIVFVNTRRLVERAAAALEQRLGEEHVVAHHGSMSRALRHAAEQKLKYGQVKCAVATASLELGIDVGAVDLVVQLGSPRSIATLLQRVGRSGHNLGGTPKGRMFALTRDQLLECAALVRGVRTGNLDKIELRDAPLDILAQQIVATCAAEEIPELELAQLIRGAAPYGELTEERLEQIMVMLSEGVSDRRGRAGAYLHRDRVGGLVRARRSARLAAITCGGAIPDNNNYTVVQWPEETQVGTVDEDFAIDSSAGDIFQLGNTSWKIRRIEAGRVIVDDARGQPPTIPFWFGEAPARTRELSDEVSALRGEIDQRLATMSIDEIAAWLAEATSMPLRAAQQAVSYLAAARAALGALPRKDLIVAERFFDEAGGMQLVIHAPLGGRINRAWGLALRKKFCVTFDFELQAVATDDGIVISLGQPHSFPLDTVFGYVPSHQAKDVLIQALLDRPMFEIRWRWNVTRSLTVLRRKAGKKIPPHLIKMRAADTLSVVFPQAQACAENIVGPREIPDHPLVFETIRDCLVEAMDIEGFRGVLEQLERGDIQVMARDTVEPSPLSHELINANPYAFLDDAPLEERRTRAVQLRRGLPASIATEGVDAVGALDEAAIALASEEVAPTVRDADELHDALLALWLVPEPLGQQLASGAWDWFEGLAANGRACRLRWERPGGEGQEPVVHAAWVATERLGAARAILGETVECTPMIPTPSWATTPEREVAIGKLVSAHLDHRGPVSTRALAAELGLSLSEVLAALLALEGDGAILRGTFTNSSSAAKKTVKQALAAADDSDLLADTEWCNRRVLARIHRLTLARLRKEIEPVSAAALMRFLLRWQRVAKNTQLIGADGLARAIEQLQGFETAAGAWEREILPARTYGYDPTWLDQMCLAGQVVWCRLSPRKVEAVEAEPLPPDDATKLLAALTQLASQRGALDSFPPILREPITVGERAAARALAQAPKPANGNRKLFERGAWSARGTRDDAPRYEDGEPEQADRGRGREPDWIAPAVRDGVPAGVITAAAETTLASALDAGATRQQAAAAIAGMLARKFPALQPLSIARVALEVAFPETPVRRNAPSRSAPLALMLRRDATWLRAAASIASSEPPILSPGATRVRDHLVSVGASFLPDLVAAMDLSPDAVEDALWELVGAGLATADGFASLRVLVDRKRGEVKSLFDRASAPVVAVPPVRKWQEAIKKARTRDRERPAHALRALPTAAGRWSLLTEPKPEQVDVEASARQLLHRYGVVFRDLLARESSLPPWRDLLVVLRRLEARGEIRGGRFVTGFVGEQFALPEALDELRGVRNPGPAAEVSRVAATDPLNLVGVLSPGPRVPAIVGNAVLYLDGHPVASLEGGELVMRAPIPPGASIDDDLTYHPPPRPVSAASQAALPL